jgi:hypothetical protein
MKSDKDKIIERIVTSIEKKRPTTDDVIEFGRCEIHPTKEIYFWRDMPIVEFYLPSYKFEKTYDHRLIFKYNLTYRLL